MGQAAEKERENPVRGRELHSVVKTMKILSCFTEDKMEWGVSELSRHLDIPKSTLFSILSTLEKGLFLEKNCDTGRYRLGLRVFQLGYVVQRGMEIRDLVRPYLEDLEERTLEIVYLAMPSNGEVLYLDSIYPNKRVVGVSTAGRVAPMHCTGLGKAMLAGMSDAEVARIAQVKGLRRFTDNTITTLEGLLNELKVVRQRGYAIDDREHDPNIKCVAVPLRDKEGKVVAAISVSGPALRFTDERIAFYAELLAATVSDISRHTLRLPFFAATGPVPTGATR